MAPIVHSQGISLTDALRAHLLRRLTVALHRFEDCISQVEVFVKDLNGAGKGGEDKNVLIKVRLYGVPPVVIEETSRDLYAAISMAAKRSKRAVSKSLRRHDRIVRTNVRQLEFKPSLGFALVPMGSANLPAGR